MPAVSANKADINTYLDKWNCFKFLYIFPKRYTNFGHKGVKYEILVEIGLDMFDEKMFFFNHAVNFKSLNMV